MLMDIPINDLAARQLRDYRRGTPGTYFAEDHPTLELEEAYRVQVEIARLRALEGESVAGYKIGCIGPKIRQQFGISGPISGFLYNTELYYSGSTLSCSRFANLAIEGEMAVRIGAKGEIAVAFPVIELHNYALRGRINTLQELIANNALNAGVVLPQIEGSTRQSAPGASEKLEVLINETPVDSGPFWSMPGGLREAIDWLEDHLSRHGLSLKPGQLVLTGTPLGLHRLKPGDRIRVVAGRFEAVEAAVVT
jgi:2-keto-4-pentenoate hydratase